MRASWRRPISGGLDGRRKSAGGWLVARTTRSWSFPPGQGACTGETYERWRRAHDDAEERSAMGLMSFVERLGRRSSRRA